MKRSLMGLLLTSAALGVEAHSAGGWRYAGWGMTLKELLAAEFNAQTQRP
jgi:hypothetical protein